MRQTFLPIYTVLIMLMKDVLWSYSEQNLCEQASKQASPTEAENNYRLSSETNKYFTFGFGAVVLFSEPLWFTCIVCITDDTTG